VRGFSSWSLSGANVVSTVAGTAPFAMAIRTPWVNTFFDGTLVVYLGVALLPLAVSWMLPEGHVRPVEDGPQRRRTVKSSS
jgi:hypothetical protein